MKIGFYDSGLGGLCVLKEFLKAYGTKYEYFYFGDSARAPYGDKSPEELISYINEILQLMHQEEVDLVISACNSSSAYLNQVDLEDYLFDVVSLTDIIGSYFKKQVSFDGSIAYLATQASVDAGRYKSWSEKIEAIACPNLVPLIEADKIDEAKKLWNEYLDELDPDTKYLIVGCTHYSFLLDNAQRSKYQIIDPAVLVQEYFDKSIYADSLISYKSKKDQGKLKLEMQFSKTSEEYTSLAQSLIALH